MELIKVYFLCFLIQICVAAPRRTEIKTKWEDIATLACSKELEKYEFATEVKGKHASLCVYEPGLGSWLHCTKSVIDAHRKSEEILIKVFAEINHLCQDFHENFPKTDDEMFQSLQNATSWIEPVSKVNGLIQRPVYPGLERMALWVSVFYGPLDNIDKGTIYGMTICAYWGGVLLFGMTYNFLGITRIKQRILKNKISAFLRSRITVPALVYNHATPVGKWLFVGLIPTRLESVAISGYLILHTLFLCIYRIDYDGMVTSFKSQIVTYISDRAGILAFAHFPLIILFGGRNNLLFWLTGIRYKSFITFHKWLGRIMFIDCIIHATGYTYFAYLQHYWRYVKTSPIWTVGRHATYFAAAMIFFSFFFFRSHYYETFLIVHIVLAICFFYACWKHCYELGWTEWIVISMVLWIMDRLLRLIKVIRFGFPLATLELCNETSLKLTVPKNSDAWKAKPGQYVYLYFMKPTVFWQSHPFTVMDSLVEDNQLKVVISIKQGLTQRLKEHLLKNEKTQIRVGVEGPYGDSKSMDSYESLLFLAGGTGVPGPLTMALTAAKEPKEINQSIKFVWILRDIELLHIYGKEMVLLEEFGVELEIHVTGVTSKDIPDLGDESEIVANTKADGPLLTSTKLLTSSVHMGRPNINELIDRATQSWNTVLIVSCGSGPFVDITRDITAQKIAENGDKFIGYVEDFQTW